MHVALKLQEKLEAYSLIFPSSDVATMVAAAPELVQLAPEEAAATLAALQCAAEVDEMAVSSPWILLLGAEKVKQASSALGREAFSCVAQTAPQLLSSSENDDNLELVGGTIRTLCRWKALLGLHRRGLLWKRIQALAELIIPPEDMVSKFIKRSPTTLKQAPEGPCRETTLQRNYSTLRELLPSLDIVWLISRQPSLLSNDATTVMRLVAFLEELFPKIAAEALIRSAPSILTFKSSSILRKWESLQQYAFPRCRPLLFTEAYVHTITRID